MKHTSIMIRNFSRQENLSTKLFIPFVLATILWLKPKQTKIFDGYINYTVHLSVSHKQRDFTHMTRFAVANFNV